MQAFHVVPFDCCMWMPVSSRLRCARACALLKSSTARCRSNSYTLKSEPRTESRAAMFMRSCTHCTVATRKQQPQYMRKCWFAGALAYWPARSAEPVARAYRRASSSPTAFHDQALGGSGCAADARPERAVDRTRGGGRGGAWRRTNTAATTAATTSMAIAHTLAILDGMGRKFGTAPMS